MSQTTEEETNVLRECIFLVTKRAIYTQFAELVGRSVHLQHLVCYDDFIPELRLVRLPETLIQLALQPILLSKIQQEELIEYMKEIITNSCLQINLLNKWYPVPIESVQQELNK